MKTAIQSQRSPRPAAAMLLQLLAAVVVDLPQGRGATASQLSSSGRAASAAAGANQLQSASAAVASSPHGLLCDLKAAPSMGVSKEPVFSWIVPHLRGGCSASGGESTSTRAPPAPFPFCDGAERDKCKVCHSSGTVKKVCVMNDYKSQVQCLDCTKEENHRDCVDSECIKPDPNPCGPGKTCQGCASGKVCVGYACLDCNAQQNYKACAAAGCAAVGANPGSPNQLQHSYQIQIKRAGVAAAAADHDHWAVPELHHDSGRVASVDSTNIVMRLEASSAPLEAGTRYIWRVRVWSTTASTGTAPALGLTCGSGWAVASFTTALFDGFSAQPIWTTSGAQYAYLRHEETLLASDIQSAAVFVTVASWACRP